MGQSEVYNFLKSNKNNWYTAKEIINCLKLGVSSVHKALTKLREDPSIECKFSAGPLMYKWK